MNRETLFSTVLSRLEVIRGPDSKGNYIAWCPFHPDGQGKPPHQANLSVSLNGFYCFACGEKGGLKKLAEKLAIEFDNTAKGEFVRTYDYLKADGTLNFQALRFKNPKTFSQRRPDGKGGWILNMNGVTRTLYKLPELLQRPDEKVFIVEGEKDVESLFALGLLATTNPCGAGKWRDSYSETLRGRDVVIIPDNDGPGKAHAEQVAASLCGKAKSVTILILTGQKPKGDASDWLSAGHNKDELLTLADSAPLSTNLPEGNAPRKDFDLTDLGNAERLVHQHGWNIRFCYDLKQWFVWDGKVWRIDKTGKIRSIAQEVVKGVLHEKIDSDPSELKRAFSLQSHNRMTGMIEEAKSMVPIQPADFDRHPWLFNCANGVVDLRTGKLMPHDPELLLSKLAPVQFDPEAQCPRWLQFLHDIMQGNEKLIGFLQRTVGYALTGDTSEQVFFTLYGDGENGKTTFVDIIMKTLGDYAIVTPPEAVVVKKHGQGIPHELARLPGTRLTAISEFERGQQLAESLIKQITGGGEITARPLYEQLFSYRPTAKIWIESNHKPVIRGRDHAIWRRVLLVPFSFRVDPVLRDRNLKAKLEAELPGIFQWALKGCQNYQQVGLMPPDEVLSAVDEYRRESDVLGEFLNTHFMLDDGGTASFRSIWDCYIEWCKSNGEQVRSSTWLGRALAERFEKVTLGHDNTRAYKGLRPKSMEETLRF